MNHAQARQRTSDKRWDWTVRNDDRIWKTGACATHSDGHATREEAERHQWEYELGSVRRFVVPDDQAGSLERCLVCSAFTASHVRFANGYTTYFLCPDHQDRASLEAVYSFRPGMQEIYS